MRKITLAEAAPHIVAIAVFLIVTIFFFSPVFFDNKSLDQQDIQQHLAASKSLRDFREATGTEGLWTPSMFSGMPAYMVNLQWSDEVLVTLKKIMTFFVPSQVRNILAAFICYYVMLLVFRIRPYLAIAGALCFGLSSYMIIGLSAGHNARIGAIAFVPLVVAGIHLAFTDRKILGFGLTALALAFQLRENHVQITYYLLIVVLAYGLVQFIFALNEKRLVEFFKSFMVLIPSVAIALLTFCGQFWAITEYSKYSIRGVSELSRPGSPPGTDGLTKEYAFAYNYGIYEPLTLLIPDFYGGTSLTAFVQDKNSASYKALSQSRDSKLTNQLTRFTSNYWGPQSGTIGPYYAGAIVIFLFFLGILYADRKYVWWLTAISVFSILISWGDSFKAFNYFLFDYLPGYSKFRSYSFGLVIILFSMPVLGMLGLENFLKESFNEKSKKKLIIAAVFSAGFCLLLFLFAGMGSFERMGESQLPVWFTNALRTDRIALLRSDSIRSFVFIAIVFFILLFNLPRKFSENIFYAFLIVLALLDIAIVDKRYFNKDNYHRKNTVAFAQPSAADEAVLRDKSYYRVYNLQETWSMGAGTCYFHHSLNGYHGAKLRRYQDLYDSCISRETQRLISDAQSGQLDFKKFGVLNMLNTKYIIYGPDRDNVIPNEDALGPAWFVSKVLTVNSANEELKKTGEINTKTTAVINNQQSTVDGRLLIVDSLAT
ncbi:MAG TPA: hypothetical protein VIT44_03590, partial [Cyclobacteriaceae bacterium]